MAERDLNGSHDSIGKGERGTTDPATPVLIGAKTGDAGRAFNGTSNNSAMRVAALCTLLPPPPPIPPSLESSPERLRNIFTNSSCWKKYTELCSVNVPVQDSSSRTRVDDLHGNIVKDVPVRESYEDGTGYSSMSRLLPFLAAITVGLVMLGVVALAYFWQQRNRRKYSCTVKYRNQTSPSRDYCSPGLYLTPSVTVETQLSLCALEDFQSRPYSIYREETWPCAFDISHSTTARTAMDSSLYESISSASCRGDNEILLQPDQLDENSSEPIYTPKRNIYCDNFNSSHPLPVECIKEEQSKSKTNTQRNRLKLRDRLAQMHEPHYSCNPVTNERNSPYVQIQSRQNVPNYRCEEYYSTQTPQNGRITPISNRNTRRGMMRKCRDAGNRVLDKLPWKSGAKSHHQPVSQNRRFDRPIRALRRSLKGLRSLGHQRLQHSADTSTIPAKSDDGHSRELPPLSHEDN